jgi:hypothetical protein
MPIHKVDGYKWGSRGRVYPTKGGAAKQAIAAYAHGWRGHGKRRAKPLDRQHKIRGRARKVVARIISGHD